MGIERYNKDDEGFRKYVELLESTPVGKREKFLEAARAENEEFARAAERAVLTFERITRLPELELTEVFGASGLKIEALCVALLSLDEALRERMMACVPRTVLPKLQLWMKDNPRIDQAAVGSAKLQIIQMARSLEKDGKLKTVALPRFGVGHFRK